MTAEPSPRTTQANHASPRGQVRAAVLAIIASIAPEADAQEIRPDRPLRDQIDLDSMDWLNVIVGLSERLGLDIPECDYARLTTLDAIVAYAMSRQADSPRQPTGRVDRSAGPPGTRHRIDATTVTVRPMRPDDLALEAEFVRNLAMQSRYNRFMAAVRELPDAKLRYLTDVDQVSHVALAATVDRSGRELLVGAVRFVVDAGGTGCEFAIAVDDAWQRTGLAGILMHALMGAARARGVTTMEGSVLAANTRMLKFMRQLGFEQERDPDDRNTVRVVRRL